MKKQIKAFEVRASNIITGEVRTRTSYYTSKNYAFNAMVKTLRQQAQNWDEKFDITEWNINIIEYALEQAVIPYENEIIKLLSTSFSKQNKAKKYARLACLYQHLSVIYSLINKNK